MGITKLSLSFSLSLFLSFSLSQFQSWFNHLYHPQSYSIIFFFRQTSIIFIIIVIFSHLFKSLFFSSVHLFFFLFLLFLLPFRRGSRGPSGRCRRRRCCRRRWRDWGWAAPEASWPPPPRGRASPRRLPRGWQGSHRSYYWIEISKYIIPDQGRLDKMTSPPHSSTHLIE